MLTEAKKDYATGRFQRAGEKYRKMLEVEPDNAQAHQGLAQCLNRLGQFEEAAKECGRALELDSELAIPYAVLGGSIYFRQRRFEESEAALRRAIELDPTIEEAYISLGATLGEQGKLQESVDVLLRAIEINPNRSIAYCNLSATYAQQKRYSDALKQAFFAFRIAPSVSTGKALVLSILGLVEQRKLFRLVMVAFLLLPFVVSLPLALPLSVLGTGYLIWGVVLNLRSGERTRGVVLLLLVVTLAALYVYHMVYGL